MDATDSLMFPFCLVIHRFGSVERAVSLAIFTAGIYRQSQQREDRATGKKLDEDARFQRELRRKLSAIGRGQVLYD